jgi:branched-chain amino acid transport system ATP-binding protein
VSDGTRERQAAAAAGDEPTDVPDAAVLTVEGVDSGYGDMQVLYDLSMHLRAEEIVCLIGPNGAGKSTVLKTVFGLLEPWDGVVRLQGEEITGTPPEAVVRKGMGYVPQVDNVFPPLTVDENLRMGGVAREDTDDVIEELYDRFSLLDEYRSTRAGSLSGGERQLVALARALVMEPDVLLIDEPSAGLAPSVVDDVFEDVQSINDLGTAVLMIEQNARAGLRISDRGYVLDQGSVRFEGPADSLLEDTEVGELYLGG